MIKFIKNLFKKKRTPKELITDHIRMFNHMLHFYIIETDFNNHMDFESKIHLKAGEYESYLNRLLNSEFKVDYFNYHLNPVLDMDNEFTHLEVISRNLKSELVYLDIGIKIVNRLKRNFKQYTYIIKCESISLGKTEVYKTLFKIGNLEICVLKGNENGI